MCPLLRKGWRQASYWFFSSFFLMVFTTNCNAVDCGNGPDDLGVILPREVTLEEGNKLEMFCHLNLDHKQAKGHNASDLVFYRDKNIVNEAFIEVLNVSTIKLIEENPPASRALYYCLLLNDSSKRENSSKTGVCLTSVVIGYKPKEVLNFSCISQNWENLTCKWTKPENPVDTKYNLYFRLPGRAGGRMTYGCPNTSEELLKELKENEEMCFWSLSTVPMYRQPYEYYHFQMIGENALGRVEFTWTRFHHYVHMIPSQPQNLVCLNTTHNSILLAWSVPSNVVHFSPGLTQRIDYQSTWDRNIWHTANTSQLNVKKQANHTFNLTELAHANTHYDIRVYMKSSIAVGSDKWSRPATLTVKTKPSLPGAAPRTDVGSFEEVIVDGLVSRDVYVYWQQIPNHLKNGNGFHYQVTKVESAGEYFYPKPDEMTNAYAKFKGLGLNSYNFTIVAVNSVGVSGPAHVYVPSKNEMPPEPISVTKIAYSPTLYELSWKLPQDNDDSIENYTIFWCNNVRDRPYQCPGYLNWIHVPKNETVRNITVPDDEIYQFAVSANTKHGSSGMVWASCTVIHNKTIGKMRTVWINRVGSDFIEVGWKFECSDRIGRVENFVIIFCPILSNVNNPTCKEPEQNLSTMPTQIHNNITGLTPYTTYMVSVAIVTHSGMRQRSDLLYGTTLESAPEPPRNVTISNITNTSVVVSWLPPLVRNGVITFYEVCYDELLACLKVDSNSTLDENNNTLDDRQFSYKVENMTSYSKYQIYVVACTGKCSNRSQGVEVRTHIGNPGIMDRPKIKFVNASQIEVSWKSPELPGGTLNFYQVAIQLTDDDKNKSTVYNSTSNKTQLPVCDSEGVLHEKYGIMVRAVNVDLQNRVYFGAWSEPTEYSCYSPGLSKPLRTAIVVFGVLLITGLAVLLLYAGKRIWLCCKEMQDLVPKLPPGLAPTCEKEKDPDFHIDVAWPSHIHDHQASGKLLLDENEVQRAHNPSGDSSGCSSGHESVSSSLTSGTQISSDSGTEADQRPPSPDGVFLNTPWDRTSLRQRRTVGDSYVKMGKGPDSIARSTPNLTDPDSLSVGATGPSYSCLGEWSLLGYGGPSNEDVENLGGREEISYCRVGLDGETVPSEQMQQQAQLIPSKGYVVLSNLSASTPQLLPQSDTFPQMESSPQPHRYVAHQIQRSNPAPTNLKASQTGKGYVMAGEHNKTSGPADLEEFEDEDEDHGFLDLESLDDEDGEPYSRFGLQPIQSSEQLVIQDCDMAKPSSGYVTLGDSAVGDIGGASRVAGASSGYVPHRHFEKRDATLLVDHLDEPYSNVVSMGTSDTNISSSKINV